MKTKLSIIIPTYNTATITAKCIQTIKKHLSGLKPEIIVVDNASSDNTLGLLYRKNLTLIKNSRNLGFAKACNQGAAAAVGDYLLFLNSDMELIDASLTKMLRFLHQNPSIGAIGPQFLNPDKTIQASVFPPQTAINAFREFWLGRKTYSKYHPSADKPSSVWAVSGGAFLISKEIFNQATGWNEKYFFYFEDLDLCRTLHKLNKKIYYFPHCRLIHHHGASGKKLAQPSHQWKRLIPGSKIYHGILKHYLITAIIYLSQKCLKNKQEK